MGVTLLRMGTDKIFTVPVPFSLLSTVDRETEKQCVWKYKLTTAVWASNTCDTEIKSMFVVIPDVGPVFEAACVGY